MYSRGFFSRIALHYGINRNYGEGRIGALLFAIRLVRKTHWPIPDLRDSATITSGEPLILRNDGVELKWWHDLKWRQWPDESYPSKVDQK